MGGGALGLEVAVVEGFGRDNPASVRIGLTNTLDRPLALGTGRRLPFLRFLGVHRERDAMLVIVPSTSGVHLLALEDSEVPPESPVDGCWRLNASVVLPARVTSAELNPGETIREVYAVYAHQANTPCLPRGTYGFAEQKAVRRPSDTGWQSVRLGFSVTITANRELGAHVEAPRVD